MSNVISIGGRRPRLIATDGATPDQMQAHLAGTKWQIKVLIERLKVVHGDDVAKQAHVDVASAVWPDP